MSKIVPIGADHAGFQLKKKIVKFTLDLTVPEPEHTIPITKERQ